MLLGDVLQAMRRQAGRQELAMLRRELSGARPLALPQLTSDAPNPTKSSARQHSKTLRICQITDRQR